MKKILSVIAAALGLLILGVLIFLARPWSDYNAFKMNSLFAKDKRVNNFRHMDRIFPAETIDAAPLPFEFRRDTRPLRVTYQQDGKNETLDQFLDEVSATGLLVIKDGKIVHERYLRGADADSRFTSWSMAKSFVSTLVGMALAEGRVKSLDDPITAYVPKLKGTGYEGVPIRHVLQMSSGIDFDEVYDDKFSDINLFFVKVFVLGRNADSVMTDYGRAGPSGRAFDYSSIDTQALAMLLRVVYDKPLTTLLEERLWHPLGAKAAFWNVDDSDENGTPIAFCCLNARLRDFAKLGQLYLQQGRWRGKQLLPAQWVVEATTPGEPFLQPDAIPGKYGPRGYQYQWWVPGDPEREYFAAGVWGQYVYVSEPDNLVIARTAVDPDYKEHTGESIDVFRAIRDALR